MIDLWDVDTSVFDSYYLWPGGNQLVQFCESVIWGTLRDKVQNKNFFH